MNKVNGTMSIVVRTMSSISGTMSIVGGKFCFLVHGYFFARARPILWNCCISLVECDSPLQLFLFLIGFKKLCCLFVLILDGDIVFINSVLNPRYKLLNKFLSPLLSARAHSKLVLGLPNISLPYCLFSNIKEIPICYL